LQIGFRKKERKDLSFFVLNIDSIRSGAKVKMQKAAFYGEEVVFPKIRLFYTSYTEETSRRNFFYPTFLSSGKTLVSGVPQNL
jgi:hypothetical protein